MRILDPATVKDMVFQNRVVMAAMVPFGLPPSPDGTMGSEVLRHYVQRASNGMGLMISQSLSVTAKKMIDGGVGVYADRHIAHLQALTAACHRHGARFFAQLAYPGGGYDHGDSIRHHTQADLEEIIGDFVRAARLCKQAGCDGIELHGAHGFFLNMLASPLSNQREDPYGGDLDGRLLLVKRILEGIKAFAGDHFLISYRMGWNDDLALDIQTAQALARMGIALLHISSGIPEDRKLETPKDFPFNEIVYTGLRVKKHVGIPVTVVNAIGTLNRGNRLLEDHLCDFVAYGRPFLADAAFLTKSLENHDYRPCYQCKTCQWFISGEKCPAQIKAR